MKAALQMLPLTLALGGLAAAVTLVLRFEPVAQTSWLIGCLVAAVLGAITLVLKTAFTGMGLTGMAALKALMTAQMLAFFLRLLVVGVGAFGLQQNGLSAMHFVISFFVVSLAQQALETRSLLSARNPVKSSEATS